MSQNYNTVAKRPRRTRVPRNRPVLVNGTEMQEEGVRPTTEDLALDTTPVAEQPVSEPVATPRGLARLPKFFSKVERNEQNTSTTDKEVADARLARAKKNMNGKAAMVKAEEAAQAKSNKSNAVAKPATPAKLFKPRHFIGMVAYLLGANALLPFEQTLAKNMHIERTLFVIPQINLPIATSFLINIITLLVFLYALVAFDLLPNGRQLAGSKVQPSKGKSSGNTQSGPATPKVAPPVMRQGVKGEHDELYQAYRSSQRKKR